MSVTYKLKTFRADAVPASNDSVNDSDAAAKLLQSIFAGLDGDVENFVVLALNARNRPIGFKEVSKGTQTACLVHPREVFRAAILLSAARIIVAHNHPSGDVTPSDDDRKFSERLGEAGELLGIPVLDSLVVSPTGWRRVSA